MLHSTWTAQRVLYRDEAKQRWRRRARVRPIFIAHKHSAVALRRVGHSTTCACNRRDWQRLNERSAVCVRAWICRGSSDSSKSSSSLARSIDTPVSAVRPSTSHRTKGTQFTKRARVVQQPRQHSLGGRFVGLRRTESSPVLRAQRSPLQQCVPSCSLVNKLCPDSMGKNTHTVGGYKASSEGGMNWMPLSFRHFTNKERGPNVRMPLP